MFVDLLLSINLEDGHVSGNTDIDLTDHFNNIVLIASFLQVVKIL